MKTTTSVISHLSISSPDWAAMRGKPPEEAADALQAILASLEGSEKQVFALRGMAALLIEERQLYRFLIDDEAGDYYQSLDRFLKREYPNSWSYIRDALRAVKELKDMPFTDLLEIKRANLEQLKKVSSGVRILPDVVKAAKSMPEKAFVAKLNKEHDQHLVIKQPVVMAEAEVNTLFEQAVDRVIVVYGCTRAEALEYIAQDILEKYPIEQEEAAG
jgi:hypothetical protein